MSSSKRTRRSVVFGIAAALAALSGAGARTTALAGGTPLTEVDLSKYVRIARYDLPEPTRTPAPPNSLLAQEASSVTYDWDTDTLFVVGDGGTSVVQVTKTGQLIDSMTLAPGGSPQGTTFYDTEGLCYVGGGRFVMTEERDRQVVRFTYVAGTVLTRAQTQTVKLGTTVGNIGLEGVANDPVTGGLILVKEKTPESIFSTTVDWAAGTASNGSPSTDESVDLFNPALVGTTDFSDVFALANVSTLTGADASHLLVISQESGKIVHVDRSGNVLSTLTIHVDAGDALSVADMTHEGVTMDNDGTIYTVCEDGGGDINHPQLWVYKPSNAPNLAPTGVALTNVVSTIPENTSTLGGIKVADITVFDDGLGANNLTVSGADAASFQIVGSALLIKPGVVLDFETQSVYHVTVNVDDPTVGASPDASVPYTLNVSDVANENAAPGSVIISEVAPWASGNSPYADDWFELTNLGATPVDVTGWKIDDNSFSAGSAVLLHDVTSIAPGKSVIFIEIPATPAVTPAIVAANENAFKTAWFGANVPAGFTMGWYSGSGVGLSTGGDAVNIFNAANGRVTGISFATSDATSPFSSFDNTAGVGVSGPGSSAPAVSLLSAVGVNHAFLANDGIEIGSPGVDFLPPTFTNVPLDMTVEATGKFTPVTFVAPTATDLVDGVRPVLCVPASGLSFPLGQTTVVCTASDLAGNSASVAFKVTVKDTKPPVVHVPADITAEATGALTSVPFGPVTATDLVDGELTATSSPASPGPFPLGTTHVDCFVTDAHGNRGAAPFNVTVVDTTAPTITVPADITTNATSPAGAVVNYVASAADAVGVTSFVCAPASGSTFPIGATTVTCTAKDAAGNTKVVGFKVTVVLDPEFLANHAADLLQALLPTGDRKTDEQIGHSLDEFEKTQKSDLWADDFHLTKKGDQVFDHLKEAAKKLLEPKKSSVDATFAAIDFFTAARALAQTAVDESTAPARDVQKSIAEIADATDDFAAGKIDDAFEDLKSAWKRASKN